MWKVDYTKQFLKELAIVPKAVQEKAETVVFQELKADDLFRLGYLEKMTGYPNKYKIRIGRYRIGITINKRERLIICQRIAHRKDIYKVFPLSVRHKITPTVDSLKNEAWTYLSKASGESPASSS